MNGCLAVIPARGGSKRIPGKNLRSLRGRPLIAYTIEAALRSELFDRVVVTTDSDEIADVASECGAEVPFLRDSSLSDDFVPVSAATIDTVNRLDSTGEEFLHVCQLMANCPLRTAPDITDSYAQLVETGSRSQLSVVRYGWQNPWWAMRRDECFTLSPLFEEALKERSQDLPELFCPTGAIWWARVDSLLHAGTYYLPGRTGWEIHWMRGLDIDTEDDWEMAEVLLALAESHTGAEPPKVG